MKVLVIPDVHLKAAMFDRAAELMRAKIADRAVCLMDIADDWGQEKNVALYIETFDAALEFAKEFKDTFWCYGNHDIPYIANMWGPGFSEDAEVEVRTRLNELEAMVRDDNGIAFIHRIDNVLFMHGGLSERFVRKNIGDEDYDDIDAVIATINEMDIDDLWHEDTPIWLRPQDYGVDMYKSDVLLQVVGHTPMREITQDGNIISCDVFSTYQNGMPIGTCEFLLIDTETWEWEGVR